ncbi:MAG: 4-hydroxy-tetrahydrodipicolinate reductase [Ruminococcaceae bacterium]|nr:4-hydroxy-tetrahydrodipicolinate reductase [Oscillospiraceae bacterium]
MTKILLSGCNGKMGQVISRLAAEDAEAQIVAGLDINTHLQNPYPVFTNLNDCNIDADVIIDFSHPSVLEPLLAFAVSKNLPVIVATTGLSEEQKNHLQETATKIPVFFSANMSLGINLLISLAKKAAVLLEEQFDIEIIEKHHNQKIDAPSGTALAIADGISEVLKTPAEYVYDRHSVRKKRSKNEIGLHAIRGGTIVGEHDIIFAGNDEVITLSHSAASKEVFAVGAIKAAKFMKGKPSGMYNMSDLIAATI